MKEWIVLHIDSLIPLALGLFVLLKWTLWPKLDSASLDGAKKRQTFVAAGALLVIVGISQFFTDSLSWPRSIPGDESSSRKLDPSKLKIVDPSEFLKPVIGTTDDGIASAEFPVAPVKRETTDRKDGMEVKRVTQEADLDGGALNLRLSFSPYPPGGDGFSDEARLAELKRIFLGAGYQPLEESVTADGIHKLVAENSGDGSRLSMRFKFSPGGLYRVLATSRRGYHEDARIGPFLDSFVVK